MSWTHLKVRALEHLAAELASFVEYGVCPQLKLRNGSREAAGVQAWATLATASPRPGYGQEEEVPGRLLETLWLGLWSHRIHVPQHRNP
ncbi:hypothetical protein ACFFLM_03175 [Deinococcus oregonensis]|uniref:Uncharacterized protein n=1 Tax=Deinococcus oregonensis TaxID=1805970 RepID=A0ABV6AU74_9DEIO